MRCYFAYQHTHIVYATTHQIKIINYCNFKKPRPFDHGLLRALSYYLVGLTNVTELNGARELESTNVSYTTYLETLYELMLML